MSAFCVVRSDAPQGSILGPVFLFHISDLIAEFYVKARLFAGACITYIEVKYVTDRSL